MNETPKTDAGVDDLARPERWFLIVLFVAGLLLRLPMLTGPLDVPDWRQAENAYASWRMMLEPAPDILNPKVPYRGANDVHINEFPLHAFCVALVYKLLGHESLTAARVFSLLMFAGSVAYLFGFARILLGRRVAWYAASVYAVLPLSIFYSRAHHYDCMIMMLAFGFLYHALRFFADEGWPHYLVSMILATLAFLMKAPYAFYLWLPLTLFVTWGQSPRVIVRRLILIGLLGLVPVIFTSLHNHYRLGLEAPYEESVVYPMKFTTEHVRRFFFGTLAMRFDAVRWSELIRREVWFVFTPWGCVLAALAPFARGRDLSARAWWTLWSLVAGIAFYVLLVFPMIASTHDYYSIPVLTVPALLIGLVLARVGAMRRLTPGTSALAAAGLLVLLMVSTLHAFRRSGYFGVDWQRQEAGRAIAENTETDAIVVSATLGRSTGWSDPKILYYGKRRGWAINWEDLDPHEVTMFSEAGGDYVAVLIAPEARNRFDPSRLFGGEVGREIPLTRPTDGLSIGSVVLFRLPPPARRDGHQPPAADESQPRTK